MEGLKISGTTENIAVLGIDTQDFQVGDSISLDLDGKELVWVKDPNTYPLPAQKQQGLDTGAKNLTLLPRASIETVHSKNPLTTG